MAYQSQSNAYTAYKVQSALGSQASGGSGIVLRQTGSGGGLKMTKAATESNEVRRDGMRTRGRHGSQKVSGQWGGEYSLGSHDPILEAITRGTWSSVLVITEATAGLTSITTGTNTIVASAGSWITAGVRAGDVARLTGHSTAANNSRDLRITGVTASTLTVPETLTADAVADTAFTLTIAKKLINPAAGSLVKRYYTVEDHELDIDGSEVATDFVWGAMKFSMAPNGILMADPSGIGTGQFTTLTGASAPLLTAPTESTAAPMSVVDATVRLGSADFVALTSFDLTMDIKPMAPDVFGTPGIKYSPDVFTGQMAISMNLSMLRSDLARVASYLAEDLFSLHVLAVENESEPKDYFSIFVPNFSFGTVDKSALSKEGGPRTQTISIPEALVGKDDTGGAYDATMIKFQSTAA
jgi:hypothetical protein